MNGKMMKKFCAALSVAAISVSLLWVGAAADGVRPCGTCGAILRELSEKKRF